MSIPLRYGTLFTALALGVWLCSCEEAVDLDIELPESRLVISSNFTPGADVRIRVSRSENVFSQSPVSPEVEDALIDIYDGDLFLERLVHVDPPQGPGYYTTRKLQPEVGVVYTIQVEAPGYPVVSAQSSIPEPVPITLYAVDNIRVSQRPESHIRRYDYRVLLDYDDPYPARNWYHLNFYQQIVDYHINGGDTIVSSESLFPVAFSGANDNNVIDAATIGGILLQDKPYPSGLAFDLAYEIEPGRQLLGKLFVELRTVSEEYYLFHSSVSRQQDNPGGGIHEPVIVYNNILNGHGIFAGYNAFADSLSLRR